jgi:ABC-2 type transport system permease protein
MIKNIIQKELAEYRQSSHLKWIVVFIYSMFGIALLTGIQYYKNTDTGSKAAQVASYKQWLSQGKKNPHNAAHYGFYAYKPLSPLAVMDKGMEGYLGQAVYLEAHNQNEVKEREANDAGSIVRFGYLTVAFLFQFLLPLAIILLGYNLFSKENEYGTLPLLLSSYASVWQLFKGKAAALYRLVLYIFLPMFLVTWISMLLTCDFSAWLNVLPHSIFLLTFYLLYLGLWVLLSLYISSFAKQSSVALVGLLTFWIFSIFFISRIGSVVVKLVVPTPSSFQFSHNIRLDNEMGIDRKTPASLREITFEDSLLNKYEVESISQLPLSIRGLNLQRSEEYGNLIFEKNYGGLEKDYLKQDAIMNLLNILSPAQSMHSISAGVSGTDINKHIHFADQAELHRRLIAKTMNDDITRNSLGIENYEVSPEFWKKIAPFKYKDQSLLIVLQHQWISIIAVIIWLFMLWLLLKKRAGQITRL